MARDRFPTTRSSVVPASSLAAALAVVLVASTVWVGLRQFAAPQSLRETRLEIVTPGTSDPISLAISPDGRQVAFVAEYEGRPHVWLRPMNDIEARPLFETAGASYPFWSPSGRHVGFFAGGELRRVGAFGGLSRVLARAPQPCGGVWGPDGVIVFVPDCAAIARVADTGGESETIAAPRSGETVHFPQLLPGAERVLFFADAGPKARGLYVLDLANGERRRIGDADSAAVYAPQGYLLFARQSTLVARRFDPRTLEAGVELSLADDLAVDPVRHVAAIAAAEAGPIVYRTASAIDRFVVSEGSDGASRPLTVLLNWSPPD